MSFQDKKFSERVSEKFSVAQRVTEEYLRNNNISFIRYGFDNHGMTYVQWIQVPEFVRNTPDLITIDDEFTFLEVKGCRDSVKIKICDYVQYRKWGTLAKFTFSIYSTTKKRLHMVTIDELEEVMMGATIGKYPDNNKEYFAIDVDDVKKYMVLNKRRS